MARKVTAQDRTVRTRWASFLSPVVGTEADISSRRFRVRLARALPGAATRDGRCAIGSTATGWSRPDSHSRRARRCARVESVGVRDSALCGALAIRRVYRRLATFARSDGLPEDAPYSRSDVAVFIGMQTPLFASPSLVLDLFTDANPDWLGAERRGFAEFVSRISLEHIKKPPRDAALLSTTKTNCSRTRPARR